MVQMMIHKTYKVTHALVNAHVKVNAKLVIIIGSFSLRFSIVNCQFNSYKLNTFNYFIALQSIQMNFIQTTKQNKAIDDR